MTVRGAKGLVIPVAAKQIYLFGFPAQSFFGKSAVEITALFVCLESAENIFASGRLPIKVLCEAKHPHFLRKCGCFCFLYKIKQ